MNSPRPSIYYFGYLPHKYYELPVNTPTLLFATKTFPNDSAFESQQFDFSSFSLSLCSGGAGFSLLLSEEGKLYSVGNANEYYQCGIDDSKSNNHSLKEVNPFFEQKFKFAFAGKTCSYAITDNGDLFSWGKLPNFSKNQNLNLNQSSNQKSNQISNLNLNQKLSTENSIENQISVEKNLNLNFFAPEPDSAVWPPQNIFFKPKSKIVSVSVGLEHALALNEEGKVYGWGSNSEGQLGFCPETKFVSEMCPIRLPETSNYKNGTNLNEFNFYGTKMKKVCCGGRHSAIISELGDLFTFGWNLYGQCGLGHTDDVSSVCHVSSLEGIPIKDVCAGNFHTICLTHSDDIFSFGSNTVGQLGIGTTDCKVFPELIEYEEIENKKILKICCGSSHSLCLTEDGQVYSWGGNKFGQLGLGHNLDCFTPNLVKLDLESKSIQAVECGFWHSLLLVN